MPCLSDNEELRELSRREVNIVLLVALAGFFTCFNFVVYLSFHDAIVHAFFPKDLDENLKQLGFLAFMLIGYVSRPIGGMVFADMADRLGRKKVMLYSLVTVVFATFLIAILPTYQNVGIWAVLLLILARFVQGIGIGAEVPISWVYVLEQVPRFRLGWCSGLIIASLILPVFFANLIRTILSDMLNVAQMMSFGWRIPFVIGAVGSLVTIILRYRLTETPVWLSLQKNQQLSKKSPIQQVFTKYRYGLLVTFLLSCFASSVYLLAFLLLPDVAIEYFDRDSREVLITSSIAVLFASFGALLFGYCVDKFNAGKVFGIGCCFLAMSSLLFFYHLSNGGEFLLLYYVIFGFFSGIIGIVPSMCVGLFPVKVRCTGIALSYNLAYTLTGVGIPVLLSFALPKLALTPVLYLVFLCIGGIMLSILLSNLHGLYRIEKHDKMTS